ncbi:GNAT family N-acetyltransferase [Desulfitobacterium sp. PCE1]|uniref:GNAT family N-acetyltransferase n=1 Tax=Desulfitobacterium sp. PCE1 TaxID=146907 RepID=UPI00036B2085|nr:GNAT family protein [Desulfitobacterium sp. PCE1]
MDISLELVSEKNAHEIYNFEIENRAYFEETIPSRGDEYYKTEIFHKIIKEIIEEQKHGQCYMHIIRNESGEMVGRVNFFSIRKDETRTAELGYRIGKNENGKGYATEAVRMALEKGFKYYKFRKIEAGTSPDNIGSQRVLEKNGFLMTKRIEKDMDVNGEWVDSLIFEKIMA